MAELSKEARGLYDGVKRIVKEHKKINEAFSQYLAHERFILESGMDEAEERKSRDIYAGAYSRELKEFERLLDEEMEKRLIADPDTKKQVLEELGYTEALEDYHAFSMSQQEDYPLNAEGISQEQKQGVRDFHRWLYRNCDKSGFAYMGSQGSVREYADSFMKNSGKDQLRALYILEKGLKDQPNAVEQADAALETYVPDLDSIKNQMIRSKFRVLARTDGTQFKWNRLSGALDLVKEANEEKTKEPVAAAQSALGNLASETGVPQERLERYVGAVGTMYRDMAGLNRIMQQRPLQPAYEAAEDYMEARNRQLAMVDRSSREVLRAAESEAGSGQSLKFIETTADMTDSVLNLYYAYSVAGLAHQAAWGIRHGVTKEDEIESVYSSLFRALGGENEQLLTVSEGAMDLGLGVLTAISSGAAAISDFNDLKNNWNVVRKTENWKKGIQVGQDVSYAVGGAASAAGALGNILGAAGSMGGSMGNILQGTRSVLKSAGSITGVTDMAAGAADFVMGGLDVGAGYAQRKRAIKAKENAGKLKNVEKKAEIRGAAKTAKRRNKWKIGQGILTAVKGAACVAAGVLALAVTSTGVGIAAAAVGTAALVAQVYYSKQKERMANNKKAIDAQILAKDREIERNSGEKKAEEKIDPKTGKRTKAITDKIQEHKALLESKKNRYKEGSRQRKYLDQLMTDDKRLKHVIRTKAAVKMGCMTQQECRQKLDMQTIEQAFRHVYLKDPEGDFDDSNIITAKEAEQYYVAEDQKADSILEEKRSRQKISGEEAVERIAYRDIFKSHGFKIKHEPVADGRTMKKNMEKIRDSMEK